MMEKLVYRAYYYVAGLLRRYYFRKEFYALTDEQLYGRFKPELRRKATLRANIYHARATEQRIIREIAKKRLEELG